jgi:hypothetical protein
MCLTGTCPSRSDGIAPVDFGLFKDLCTLVLVSARELELEGRLEEAFDRYLAGIRMARHVASRGDLHQWSVAVDIEANVCASLTSWLAHPQQTDSQIDKQRLRLVREFYQMASFRDALLVTQANYRKVFVEDDDPQDVLPPRNFSLESSYRLVDRFCPWERVRRQRVLDLWFATQQVAAQGFDVDFLPPRIGRDQPTELEQMRRGLQTSRRSGDTRQAELVELFLGEQLASSRSAGSKSIPWNWIQTTPWLAGRLSDDLPTLWKMRLRRELIARSTLLRFRLAAYRKKFGEYPERIDRSEFGMEAVDPCTRREFEYFPRGYLVSREELAEGANPVRIRPHSEPAAPLAPIRVRVMDLYSQKIRELEAGRPFLASGGPGQVAHFFSIPLEPQPKMRPQRARYDLDNSPLTFELP